MNAIRFLKSQVKDILHYHWKKVDWNPSDKVQKTCDEIDTNGFAIVPKFLSGELCQSIRSDIDTLFEKYSSRLWRDELGADERFFGIETQSELINKYFYSSSFINEVLDFYEGFHEKKSFIMAGRIHFKESNLGSGQGWHRDRVDFKQTKAILYLSDTDENNGPLQYLSKSHKPGDLWKDFIKFGVSLTNSRIEDEQVTKMIASDPGRLQTFLAPAGTLIFLDTRGIHRGAPLKDRMRYALTNYNWYNTDVPGHIEKLVIR